MFVLITGGSCSGKSAFAETIAAEFPGTKYYIATMEARDLESLKRIERHQNLRAGKGFHTIEQGRDVNLALCDEEAVALVECLSNLVANEMFGDVELQPAEAVIKKIVQDVTKLKQQVKHLVIVTNNVFEDGVQYDKTTMDYLTALGKINCVLSEVADQVYEVLVGIPVLRKGER